MGVKGKGLRVILGVLLMMCLFVVSAYAKREIDPLVSPDWVGANIVNPRLVILDVRSAQEYAKGHIPGAINVPVAFPASAWTAPKGNVVFEVPPDEELVKTIRNAGIKEDSWVVIVGRTTGPMPYYAMADATRVAITLLYAGIENVAIMEGGFDKWVWEGKPVSKVAEKPKPSDFKGNFKKEMFATKEEVLEKIGKAVIIDSRDADVYFGVKTEPWSPRPGHIPTAKSLPTPWLWDMRKDYGVYREREVLAEMVKTLIGEPTADKEVIVYCGVGGYASTMYFVLKEVLGYPNVKMYDGSAQEWNLDPNAPLVKFKWE